MGRNAVYDRSYRFLVEFAEVVQRLAAMGYAIPFGNGMFVADVTEIKNDSRVILRNEC